eukprot:12398984-Karenia_brevis.AAC.1
MGWQTQWNNGFLMLKDHAGDVWKPNPEYGMGLLRSMFEEARIQILWSQATMHRHGTGTYGARPGPDCDHQTLPL